METPFPQYMVETVQRLHVDADSLAWWANRCAQVNGGPRVSLAYAVHMTDARDRRATARDLLDIIYNGLGLPVYDGTVSAA